MKQISSAYKNEIKEFGRELDSIITYELNGETIELGNAQLNSVSPHYEGGILKSVMKTLEVDSNEDIPLGTIINYQFGIKVRDYVVQDYRDNYEYINYGNYVVYKSEKQEDTNSFKLICYDKMLYSMKDYSSLNITYPITIRNYINAIATYMGVTFANTSDTFVNYDKEIPNELYLSYNEDKEEWESLGYTFRDVLDELSEVTASTICINENDELEVRYISDTEDTINEEYLKNVNVNFGQLYGPINTIVFSRSSGTDKVYRSQPADLPDDEKISIEIADNQILNGTNRDEYLQGILNQLYGLEYYLNDFSSTGITYYELCDRYDISIGENTYSCVMLNDDVQITTGLEENIHTDMPEESVTDYTKADTTDRRINQTQLIVDKQQGIIESLVSNTTYVSDTKTGVGTIQLENAYEGQLYKLSIKGDISLLFPTAEQQIGYALVPHDGLVPSNELVPSNPVPYGNEVLYPSGDLYPKGQILLIDEDRYLLDFDFLNYISDAVCDEFVYDNGVCYIIRRVGINSQGEKYALSKEVIEPRNGILLNVKSNSIIKLESFDNEILSATYLLQNTFTDNFATEVYVQSNIRQTADSIMQQVNAKVGDDEIIAQLNLAIENGQGIVNLKGNQVTIDSDYFKLYSDGSIQCENADMKDATMTNANIVNGDINITSDATTSHFHLGLTGFNCYTDIYPNGYTFNNEDNGVLYKVQEIGYNNTNDIAIFIKTSDDYSSQLAGGYLRFLDDNNFANINIDGYNGDIHAEGTIDSINGICQGSREEIKKNFEKFDNALDIIKNIDIYKYHLKEQNDNEKKHIGFVIGNKYKYSEAITTQENDGVDLYSFVSVCCQAIQEQQEIIEKLTKRIEALERESDK